jgi:hypothetical protein
MVAEDKLLGFEVEELWSFKQDANRLLLNLLAQLQQILNYFKVDLLVFHQHALYFMQSLNCVYSEDLVKEVIVRVGEKL